jgi:tripartite ATP-independent transporter DctP family solute receptor
MTGLGKYVTKFVLLLCTSFFIMMALQCRHEGQVKVIKLAHGLDSSHSVHKAMEFMAEYVYEKSQGKMRIDIYPSEQLGSERECLELLQIGSLGMTKVSCSVLEGFVPSMSVLSLPFIFRDEAHKFKVLEGEIGRELLLDGEKFWLRGLCFFDAGSRSFYSKDRPVLKPSDLEGLKIRTQESPTSLKMVQALGGSPTPISWGELYSALQQGVVDGAENNPPSFYLSRHYEVCKYYCLDEHTSVPDILLISTKIWEDLDFYQQTILQEASDKALQLQKELWKSSSNNALKQVQQAGIEIFYPEKTAFADQVAPLLEEYKKDPRLADLIHTKDTKTKIMWKSVKKTVDKCLEWILILLMAANVINVLWQVFTRFILKNPSSFTEELARYLLIWVGLLGAAYASGKKMHLAIDIILENLKGAAKKIAELTIQVFIFLFAFFVMVIGGLRLVTITLTLNQISAALRIKLGYVYLVIPISGILILFYAAAFILNSSSAEEKKRENKLPVQEGI